MLQSLVCLAGGGGRGQVDFIVTRPKTSEPSPDLPTINNDKYATV